MYTLYTLQCRSCSKKHHSTVIHAPVCWISEVDQTSERYSAVTYIVSQVCGEAQMAHKEHMFLSNWAKSYPMPSDAAGRRLGSLCTSPLNPSDAIRRQPTHPKKLVLMVYRLTCTSRVENDRSRQCTGGSKYFCQTHHIASFTQRVQKKHTVPWQISDTFRCQGPFHKLGS